MIIKTNSARTRVTVIGDATTRKAGDAARKRVPGVRLSGAYRYGLTVKRVYTIPR